MAGLRNRKGQEVIGSRAAGLIALILAFIIIYILFLPPKAREALLFGNETEGITGIPGLSENQTLLLVNPGRIEFAEKNEIQHQINPATLFSKTQALELKKIDSIYVKNTWFSERTGSFLFTIKDLSNTDNVILSFNVQKSEGVLLINVNGKEVVAREVEANHAVKIPKEILKDENTVDISVSGVGAAFWRTNEYLLSNVRVTADVTGVETLESRFVFSVTSTEKNSADSATLRFFVDCSGEQKVLDIFINDHNIFSAVPDCGPQVPIEFLPQYLLSGENTIRFKTYEGADYLLDQIRINTKLKTPTNPTYFFSLSSSQLSAINTSSKKVILKLRFADAVEQKTAEIWVNGQLTNLNTKDLEWTKDISQFIIRDSNTVEIRPATSLFISELSIRLE